MLCMWREGGREGKGGCSSLSPFFFAPKGWHVVVILSVIRARAMLHAFYDIVPAASGFDSRLVGGVPFRA